MSSSTRDVVFVVHGIGAPTWIMASLARRLDQHGFEVFNWGYPSILQTLEHHGERLSEAMASAAQQHPQSRVHIVAHSMGSIVTRVALGKDRPEQLGRAVFLGPPHRGAPLASLLGPWLKPVCRPLDQLASRADSFVNCLSPPEGIEFGVIAAQLDLLVPLASTHLPGETAHAVVRCLHTGLLFRADVADMSANFLRHGRFEGMATDMTPAPPSL